MASGMTWFVSALALILLVTGSCDGSHDSGESPVLQTDCTSDRDPGVHCGGFSPRWYFNRDTGRCEVFLYRGCSGNGNRYNDKAHCERSCMRTPASSDSESQVTDDKRDCESEFDVGPCIGATGGLPRWYFNVKTGHCESFNYGGCMGNDNRYNSKEQCEQYCHRYSNATRGEDEVTSGQNNCTAVPIKGPCNGYFPRWSFKPNTGVCERFVYGGCGGNANKYLTKEKCDNACHPTPPYPEKDCASSYNPGPCIGNFTRWYFNERSRTCETFPFGGCLGNMNNYGSQIRCELACKGRAPDNAADVGGDCTSDYDQGPCASYIPRWYFNNKTRRCELFTYGGCLGNDNRYVSKELCEHLCLRGR